MRVYRGLLAIDLVGARVHVSSISELKCSGHVVDNQDKLIKHCLYIW